MKSNKLVYPIVLTPDDYGYLVYIPDFDNNTEGSSLAEALFMARDAIGMLGLSYEDVNKKLPKPSAIEDITCNPNEIKTLIDVDLEEYKRKHDNRAIKKTLTIPSWLNEEALANNINFSSVLQEALKKQLHIKEVL